MSVNTQKKAEPIGNVPRKSYVIKTKDEIKGVIVDNRYKLGHILGSGSYGEIRCAKDMKTNVLMAAKLEQIQEKRVVNNRKKDSDKPVTPPLEFEYNCYKMFRTVEEGFPAVYFYGKLTNFKFNILIIEMMGKNLDTVFIGCGKQFSMKTIIYIFVQLLQRIEQVHNNHIVFRDIKPENFVLGREGTPKENIIHIIDFGLSKKYYDPYTKEHIPMNVKRHLTGTARYMSINANKGREQSRRDDLESIGYMMMYFLRQGKLPWSGFKTNTDIKDRYHKILTCKRATPIESLCYGFPEQFANYFRYVRQMEFEEKPDYQQMKTLFIKLFENEHFDDNGLYDWNN